MYPRLVHLYGPLWIQSYGTLLALGVLVFLYLSYHHPWRKQYISGELYFNAIFLSIVSGIVGSRLLCVITDWHEFSGNWVSIFYPWIGGLTIQGSVLGVLIVIPWYLKWHKVPVLPLFDLAALYAPIIQAIARFGCLLAGCCYGAPCSLPWAITFTASDIPAPTDIPLHPTQIYTALISFLMFFVLYWLSKQNFLKHGQVLFMYLMLENLSRFTIDFWRGDRAELTNITLGCLSFNFSSLQLLALACIAGSLIGFIWVSMQKRA